MSLTTIFRFFNTLISTCIREVAYILGVLVAVLLVIFAHVVYFMLYFAMLYVAFCPITFPLTAIMIILLFLT